MLLLDKHVRVIQNCRAKNGFWFQREKISKVQKTASSYFISTLIV